MEVGGHQRRVGMQNGHRNATVSPDVRSVQQLFPEEAINYIREHSSAYGGLNMSKRTMRMSLVGAVLLVFVFQAGCAVRSINQIMADPQRYANKEVGIKGEVTESYSVVGHGAYRVDDGTGRLWVISDTGVPRKGAKIVARGTIKDAYNFGELGTLIKIPEQASSGMVMIEKEHKAQ